MPIYEYQCQNCQHHFDALQKFSDKPLINCPQCGKSTLRKCISAPNFQLKGSGWYESDYKKKKEPTQKNDEPKTEKKPKDDKK